MAKINLFELGKKLSQKEDLSNINTMFIIEPEDAVSLIVFEKQFTNYALPEFPR